MKNIPTVSERKLILAHSLSLDILNKIEESDLAQEKHDLVAAETLRSMLMSSKTLEENQPEAILTRLSAFSTIAVDETLMEHFSTLDAWRQAPPQSRCTCLLRVAAKVDIEIQEDGSVEFSRTDVKELLNVELRDGRCQHGTGMAVH